jgi:cytochrome c oxidase subunit 2
MTRWGLFPEAASTMASRVDHLLLFEVTVSAFFAILIATLIVVFMFRYRRRGADERGASIHGSLALEALWTGIPLALTMVMFGWGASIFVSLHTPPADAIQVNVVGKQWMWKVQHMEGRREIDTLHVPVGRPIKVVLTSEDVIHSFFVPAFRVKQDAVPGRYTSLWFQATKPGRYHLFCAEYCGTLHSRMLGEIVVMEPAAFQEWLRGGPEQTAGAAGGSLVQRGQAVFEARGCPSCHVGATARGPSLVGLVGKRVALAGGGEIVADDAYLRESILDPRARVVRGYTPIMPTFQGLVTEEQVMQLIAYIRSLDEEPSHD